MQSTGGLLRRGHRGPVVAEVRSRLALLGLLPTAETAAPRAEFDADCERAVRAFQQARGLTSDGIVGPETYRSLDEARWRLGDRLLSHAVTRPFVGDDVAELQRRLLDMGFDPGRCDGIFGDRTDAAVREFQRNVGLQPDGCCGPATLAALARLARTVVGGRPEGMREAEQLHRAGPALGGKLVVVDPGHGGADRGAREPDQDEASIVEDLAARLEARLAASGMRVFLTRGVDQGPTDAQRADFANAVGADLFVSLHVDTSPSAAANGVATFYYGGLLRGRAGVGSPIGERLAEVVQRHVVARTDLLDCGTHGKTWELLRRTRMPAVRLELGYLSCPRDAARLADRGFRDTVAEAVLAALQQLYAPLGSPQPASGAAPLVGAVN